MLAQIWPTWISQCVCYYDPCLNATEMALTTQYGQEGCPLSLSEVAADLSAEAAAPEEGLGRKTGTP